MNLTLGDGAGQEQAIIREIQRHPVSNRMVHVDFQRINLEEDVQVSVPLHVVGSDPKGVKNGGILEHVLRTVEVLAKPLSIPKHLDVDLSDLDLNQSFHVSDLKLPEGVTVVDEPDTALFTILPPKGEAEAGTAAEGAEPEVIGVKKKEEEKETKK
jgi:large subunit ribosomal protein L25